MKSEISHGFPYEKPRNPTFSLEKSQIFHYLPMLTLHFPWHFLRAQLPGPNACGVLSHGLRLRGLSLAGETLAEAIGLLEWWDWGLLLGYYQ